MTIVESLALAFTVLTLIVVLSVAIWCLVVGFGAWMILAALFPEPEEGSHVSG